MKTYKCGCLKTRAITGIAAAFLLFLCADASAVDTGKLSGVTNLGSSFQARYERARVDLTFLKGDILRVEITAPEIYSTFPSHLTVEPAPPSVWINSDPESRTLTAGGLAVRYGSDKFSLSVVGPKGENLLTIQQDGFSWETSGSYAFTFQKEEGDRFFGAGEELPPDFIGEVKSFDRNKKIVKIFNQHPPPSEMGLPVFYNPRGYSLFIDNPWTAELNFKKAASYSYSATGGPARFYLIYGPDAFSALDKYTALTGRPPMPPRWAAGYMQSRYGYKNETDYRWLMDNFRSKSIPADTLIFDLDWFGDGRMGDLWWNKENFPDGPAFQKELDSRGFKAITIVEPYVFKRSYNYEEAFRKGLFTRLADGSPYEFPFWGGAPAGLLDFSNPDTREWFAGKISRIKDSGVDAWWTDLDEPEKDFPDTKYFLGPRDAAHNLLGFFMNKSIYDLYDSKYPDDRVFIMTRSGFCGIQRFGSGVWSGDVQASFKHLANQTPIGLAVSLSGIPMFNSDTGGFHNEPSAELFVRWMQFSAFNPIYRAHGNHTIREPWSFGPEAEQINRKYLELRYMMVPYLYSLFRQMNVSGAPVMRPLFMEFPEDADSLDVDNQFMYGPWLLVAPVTEEGAKSRKIYLPPGNWTYMWDDRMAAGPKGVKIPVDLETMPLFVREGALLPMGPVMNYTGENPAASLTIHYYPSEKPTSFELYEDDGESRAYERGEYTTTELRGARDRDGKMSVTVAGPSGKYKNMPETRDWEIVFHHCDTEPARVMLTDKPLAADSISYARESKILKVSVRKMRGDFSVSVEF